MAVLAQENSPPVIVLCHKNGGLLKWDYINTTPPTYCTILTENVNQSIAETSSIANNCYGFL